jgi:hypothetical protein
LAARHVEPGSMKWVGKMGKRGTLRDGGLVYGRLADVLLLGFRGRLLASSRHSGFKAEGEYSLARTN